MNENPALFVRGISGSHVDPVTKTMRMVQCVSMIGGPVDSEITVHDVFRQRGWCIEPGVCCVAVWNQREQRHEILDAELECC